MATAYGIDRSRNLKWIEHQGVVDIDRVKRMHVAMTSLEQYTLDLDFYVSLAKVTEFDIAFPDMMRISGITEQGASGQDDRPKVAIFAVSDVQFGMSRMYAMILENVGKVAVEIFRAEADAFAWLRVDIASLDDLRGMQHILPD